MKKGPDLSEAGLFSKIISAIKISEIEMEH
jgi:hypothetical protein